MKRICCGFALALCLPVGAMHAQEAPALARGARVRVLAPKHVCFSSEGWPCYRRVVGTLTSIDTATIVMRLENGEPETVPRAPATRLELSAGEGACGAGCIGLGFVGGTAVGALAGAISVHSCRAGGGGELCGLAYLWTLPAGAVLGIVVGALVRVEKWQSTPMPARLSIGRTAPAGFALGLSVRF